MTDSPLQQFLVEHRLPDSYLALIDRYFRPLADLIQRTRKERGASLLIGINGCQGSGKTTLADALVVLLRSEFSLSAIAISIDDFYLTRQQRTQLACDIHPLLATRGVPGTHDMELAERTLNALLKDRGLTAIPRFEKAIDDRQPEKQWPQIQSPVDIVILEGWCVGSTPQAPGELIDPVNELEEKEDTDAQWRRYVNESLEALYQPLFNRLELLIMLKAPSFESVLRWRTEQESKLRDKKTAAGEDTSALMSNEEIKRFIQHYQRLTEHNLRTLPSRASVLYEMGENRQILSQSFPHT